MAIEAWVRSYTGPGYNYPGSAVAVDSSNSVIVLNDYSVIKYSSMGMPLWTNLNDISPVNTESSKSLKVDRSNSVIVAGTVGTANYDYAVIKYSSAGVPLWTNRYDGPVNGTDALVTMVVDGSNNVIVTGSSQVTDPVYRIDYCTIKYSIAGVPLWTNFYNGPASSSARPIAVAVDSSNNVVVTGITDPDGGCDIATIKYSNAGVPLWTNLYNGPANLADYPVAVAVDGSNNVIVTGNLQMEIGGAGNNIPVTIKYSSAGSPMWINRETTAPAGYVADMAVDSRNNILVVGFYGTGFGYTTRTTKYSSAGALLWVDRSISAMAAEVAVDDYDNVIVTGMSGDYHLGHDFLTIKFSSAGTPIWTMTYDGGGTDDQARAVTVDAHGSVIVTGDSSGSATTVKYVTDGSLPVTFTWLTNNATITVTGCNASGGVLTIPPTVNGLPVTSIGDSAFQGNFLTSVSLPNTVTNIGTGAFANCAKLKSLTIPTNVHTIGAAAFSSCYNLSAVSIPNSVQILGYFAFSGCISLVSATIGNSITNLEDSVFDGCSSLTSITIPDSVARFGTSAFSGCSSLTSVTIPDGVARIDNSVFLNCSSLTNLTFGTSVTSIGSLAFLGCSKLGSIIIPNSVTSIGDSAFYGCTSLTNVVIPDGVTTIWGDTFEYCSKLTRVTIPPSVTSIEYGAFAHCTSLESITIPDSVTRIGEAAFWSCINLTGVYFGGNAPTLGSSVFLGDNNATAYYLAEATGWGPTYGGCPTAIWYLYPVFPFIKTHPQSQALQYGESTAFTVIASGGFLSYQWCFNGTNLPNGGNVSGATSASLAITSVQTTHAGSYSVVVTNASGSVTSSVAVLTVLTVSPAITSPPVNRTNVAGSTATFTVAASGTAPLAYQWRINGANVPGGWNISGVQTTNLTISSVLNNDAGSYSVVVTNAFGSVTSSVATLTIVPDPLAAPLAAAVNNLGLAWTSGGTVPWFAQTNTTRDGEGAAQSGVVADSQESWMQTTLTGPGTLTYWWKVSSETRYDFLSFYLDGVLQSGSISGDVGWQKRTNSIGSGAHTAKWRYMKDAWASSGADAGWLDEVHFVPDSQAPLVETPPVSRTNVAGTTATFTIVASSKSPLFFQWRKNETNLFNSGNMSGVTTPTLVIGDLQTSDAGNYTVVVSNAYGSVTSSVAVLTVLAPNNDLYITNATVTVDGYANFEVVTPFAGVYSLLISTNLRDWESVDSLEGPTNRFFVNSYPTTMAEMGTVFVRVEVGLVPQYQFNLDFSTAAGTLVVGTPSVGFPLSVQSYSANLEVKRIASLAPATNVFFTGPPGSGLTNALPEGSDLDPDNYGADYWVPSLANPSVPPLGRWTVSFGGKNLFFDQPDAQTRFVVPHPTVVVSNSLLVSVNWVYRDPTTGQTLAGSPAFVRKVVVQVFGGIPSQEIYDSDDLPRGTTAHVFSSTLLWSMVESLTISYSDDLAGNGNSYTVFYTK